MPPVAPHCPPTDARGHDMGSEDGVGREPRARQLRRVLHLARSQPLTSVGAAGLLLCLCSFVGLWSFRHAQCYSREAGVHLKPAAIADLSRPCPSVQSLYKTIEQTADEKPHICLTTLTDRKSQSLWQRWLRCRDFDGVAKLTLPNIQGYAEQHDYAFQDASDMIDTSRPPAWSKIKAVQHLLDKEQNCDWVFWIDADIVVMNSSIAVESFLPTANSGIDLLITMDRRLTANSGAWLIRNTQWSRDFLQTWWNMRRWVREPGLSLSGDNAAFGHLMEERMLLSEHKARIKMVPRCTFNSFAVFVREESSPLSERDHEWYLSKNFYHRGDFMAHASGVDHKEACVSMLLEKAS